MYKRGTSCVSRWKLKWAVLYDQPNVALYIYDKRDHPEPKYIIKPDSIEIYPIEDVPKAFMENTREAGFVVISRNRKVSNRFTWHTVDIPIFIQFYFAAQNLKEREEWIQCLRAYGNSAQLSQPQPPLDTRALTVMSTYYAGDAESQAPVLADDNASVYSAYSYRSAMSRASSRATGMTKRTAVTAVAAFERAESMASLQQTYGDIRPLVLIPLNILCSHLDRSWTARRSSVAMISSISCRKSTAVVESPSP